MVMRAVSPKGFWCPAGHWGGGSNATPSLNLVSNSDKAQFNTISRYPTSLFGHQGAVFDRSPDFQTAFNCALTTVLTPSKPQASTSLILTRFVARPSLILTAGSSTERVLATAFL
ncbi:hypothetical protein GOBAR_DD23030 [Gossypium barbadense]|nr:hypothetical protein GOBAR_DD23030 [Gossypium barbadense]